MCAFESGKDSCQGDSGGPLFLPENGRFVAMTYAESNKNIQGYSDWSCEQGNRMRFPQLPRNIRQSHGIHGMDPGEHE